MTIYRFEHGKIIVDNGSVSAYPNPNSVFLGDPYDDWIENNNSHIPNILFIISILLSFVGIVLTIRSVHDRSNRKS
jgi:hypothetical protein